MTNRARTREALCGPKRYSLAHTTGAGVSVFATGGA